MKKLLLTTVLTAAVAMPAVAQTADDTFRTEAQPSEIHASNFLGMRIYRADEADQDAYEGAQQNWDDIGEVNDVILSREGEVDAVLVDIGGFLGIGENRVAVNMDSLRFVSDSSTADDENDFFLVLNAPVDSLQNAPVYGMSGSDHASADGMETEMTEETDQASDTGDTNVIPGVDTNGDATADQTDQAQAEGDMDQTRMATDDAAADDPAATDQMAADSADATAPMDGTTAPGVASVPTGADGYMAAEDADLTAERLTGAPVYDSNDERVGEVGELLLTDEGQVRAAVVDVGGFLGIGEKPVELNLEELRIMKADGTMDLRVYVPKTEEEMEAMPRYEG